MNLKYVTFVMVLLSVAGCGDTLRDELTERQANDVEALLQQYEIPSEKERSTNGSWRVQIDRSRKMLANDLLHTYNLPRESRPSLGQIFPGGGLMTSETEEHIRYQYGLAEELSRSLENIDGVLSARVHVALPPKKNRDIRREKIPPSASVLIRYRTDIVPDLLRLNIQKMVAGGISGATPENVSVFWVPVIPAMRNSLSNFASSWFGIYYRPDDFPRVFAIFILPWIAVLGSVFLYFGPGRIREKFETISSRVRRKVMPTAWDAATKDQSGAGRSKWFSSRNKSSDA